MLKRFEVRNYKNFKDTLVVDFENIGGYKFNQDCIVNNLLGKAIIYGRNATGKTNLGLAFGDIWYVVSGQHVYDRQIGSHLNACSREQFSTFRYDYDFEGDNLTYIYSKNKSDELETEKLIINGETVFDFSFRNMSFDVLSLKLISADMIQVDRYIDALNTTVPGVTVDNRINNLPFLRFILNNTALPQNSILRKLESHISRMVYFTTQYNYLVNQNAADNFAAYLDKENNLREFEQFLNKMGVECKLRIIERLDGNKSIYFDLEKPVPFFATASSGTLTLTAIYSQYIATQIEPSFIYMDEFDAFYHYEMAEDLVRYFKSRYPRTQILFTTHNTNLMTNHLMRPDCLLILSRDGRLTSLCDATERELREGHNLEKLYIGGEFEEYE